MRLKWAVAAMATAGLGSVLPAHAQELEPTQMTVASELTTDGFRVAEGTDGFLLVEHGIWRKPPTASSEPPATDAGRTYLPYRYPKPQGSTPSGFRRASYLPHVYAAEAQYSLPSGLLDALVWTESRYNPMAISKAGAAQEYVIQHAVGKKTKFAIIKCSKTKGLLLFWLTFPVILNVPKGI